MPVRVPWMISSPPHFQVWTSDDGVVRAIAFIAFFKLETANNVPTVDDTCALIIEPPSDFIPSGTFEGAPYRLVRVSFESAIYSEVSDREFPDDDFDWSEVPFSKTPFNSVTEYLKAADGYLFETSTVPDPGVSEVKCSPLLEKLRVDPDTYSHFVLVGEDSFFDVVAKDWKWEPGQVVD